MSAILQSLLAQANQAADISEIDMSETSSGGERRLLPASMYLGTLVEYIEVGKQKREFNGEAKAPALTFRLGFAIHGVNDDGSPHMLRTFDLSLGNNEKSKAKIAFDRMNYKQTAKHFAQLLGQSFLIEVKVVKAKSTGKERNEVNFATMAPPIEPMSKQAYPVPAIDDKYYRLFLWDLPTKEGWDSLFIEGKTDDGKSKNYIQEICMNAVDFHGSALEQLIGGGVPDLTVPTQITPEATAGASTGVALEVPKLEPQVTAQVSQPTAVAPAVTLPTIPTIPGIK